MMAMDDDRRIEAYGVYGNGPTRLEIPHNVHCLGLPEYFADVFKFGSIKPNDVVFDRQPDKTSILLHVYDLAEACFGRVAPRDLVTALRPKMSEEGDSSEAFLERIGNFESDNLAVSLAFPDPYHPYPPNLPSYYIAPINMELSDFMREMDKRLLKGFLSGIGYKEVCASKVGRGGERAYFPIRNCVPLARIRDSLLRGDPKIHLYRNGPTSQPNFDPFHLIREYSEIDTDGLEVRAKPDALGKI